SFLNTLASFLYFFSHFGSHLFDFICSGSCCFIKFFTNTLSRPFVFLASTQTTYQRGSRQQNHPCFCCRHDLSLSLKHHLQTNGLRLGACFANQVLTQE